MGLLLRGCSMQPQGRARRIRPLPHIPAAVPASCLPTALCESPAANLPKPYAFDDRPFGLRCHFPNDPPARLLASPFSLVPQLRLDGAPSSEQRCHKRTTLPYPGLCTVGFVSVACRDSTSAGGLRLQRLPKPPQSHEAEYPVVRGFVDLW